MTLYLIQNNTPVEWHGERINDVSYPLGIEQSWSDDDLAALGLYRASAADPVPAGQIITASSVQLVDGKLKWVNTTRAAVPSDFQLTKRQVCAALILSGTTDDPDTFVRGVLATIPDAQAKALALNDWANAPFYTRDNALFADPSLLGAAGLTSDQIDQFWMLAKDQPQ